MVGFFSTREKKNELTSLERKSLGAKNCLKILGYYNFWSNKEKLEKLSEVQ